MLEPALRDRAAPGSASRSASLVPAWSGWRPRAQGNRQQRRRSPSRLAGTTSPFLPAERVIAASTGQFFIATFHRLLEGAPLHLVSTGCAYEQRTRSLHVSSAFGALIGRRLHFRVGFMVLHLKHGPTESLPAMRTGQQLSVTHRCAVFLTAPGDTAFTRPFCPGLSQQAVAVETSGCATFAACHLAETQSRHGRDNVLTAGVKGPTHIEHDGLVAVSGSKRSIESADPLCLDARGPVHRGV